MCPWRALYSPQVREVMNLSWSVEEGNLGAVLGQDPPGWLAEGVGVYQRALRRTRNEDEKLRIKALEQKQKGGRR